MNLGDKDVFQSVFGTADGEKIVSIAYEVSALDLFPSLMIAAFFRN
jgi:hypothetical protein